MVLCCTGACLQHVQRRTLSQEVTACGAFGYIIMSRDTLCDMSLPLSIRTEHTTHPHERSLETWLVIIVIALDFKEYFVLSNKQAHQLPALIVATSQVSTQQ